MKIKIVVDSASDIGFQRASLLDIDIVPLTVSFGDDSYKDGIDIKNDEFYKRLGNSKEFPKTSAPSPESFSEAYRSAIKNGAQSILSIHISSELSASYSSGSIAARNVTLESGVPITVFDSRSVTMGTGLIALALAEDLKKNYSPEELLERSRSLAQYSRSYILLDTIDYLQKGGRLSKTQATIGSILNIKPIISVSNGLLVLHERTRSRSKGISRIQSLIQGLGKIERIGVLSSVGADITEVKKNLEETYEIPVEEFQLGPVTGAYAGPKAIGISAIYQNNQ